MMLLAPWALWFLVAGGAVVALYLLKIKRRQATVPALDFWLALAGQTRVHSLWERLKRILSMLLWLVIVACVVLALGNPIFSLGRIKPRAIAVVIDNSASMQTVEGGNEGRTRFDLARAALADLASRRPVSDEWLVIEAGASPKVLQPWTFDSSAAGRAAKSLAPFNGSGNLAAGIELASQLLSDKNEPSIVVLSDGAAGDIAALGEKDPRIVYWPVGETSDNLGISRLAVRADRLKSNYLALISVVNASDQQIDTQVVLEIDGSAFGVELVSVGPHATWEKTITIDLPERADGASIGGVLRASIERADALMLDNQAIAVLEPIRPAVIWLVSAPETAFFFERALASMTPLVWPEESLTLTLERYEQAAATLASAAATGQAAPVRPPDLVIFNGCTPRKLPTKGQFIFTGAAPADLPMTVVGEIRGPEIFISPKPHPLTAQITLQGAKVASAQRVTLTQPALVLASTGDGDPLITLFEQPDRQTLVLAFDIMKSDLPFRNAFPLLLRNAVGVMHEDAPSLLRAWYPIGARIEPLRTLPAATTKATLAVQRSGKTETVELPVTDARFTFADTATPTAVRLDVGDETSFAAVSLGDARESRIGVVPPPEDPAGKLALSRKLFGSLPWVMFATLAAAFITLEWLTYHFRWTE